MGQISDFFRQAELSLAAYANLVSGEPIQTELIKAGFSLSQAAAFASKWKVIDQYTHSHTEVLPTYDDGGNLTGYTTLTSSNGLSVTLFEEVGNPDKRYVAIRGTEFTLAEITGDLTEDGGILLHGNLQLSDQYQTLKSKIEAWQSSGILPDLFTVTGHSLGGWLAGGLAEDFPGSIEHTFLYNTPGVDGALGGILQQLNEALGTSFASAPSLANLTNIRASTGISPIAGLGLPLSPPVGIHIEDQSFSDVSDPPMSYNHSQRVLTDSLAVYALFAELSSSLTVVNIGTLLNASGNRNAMTLEDAVNALGDLFQAGSAITVVDDRDTLYTRMQAIRDSAGYQLAVQARDFITVQPLAMLSREHLVSRAKLDSAEGLAYRYAIANMIPFAISGDAALYSLHNASGELDLYDPATGQGELTERYLRDRAAMLTWQLQFNTDDIQPVGNTFYKFQSGTPYYFRDMTTDTRINVAGGLRLDFAMARPENDYSYIVFGTENDHPIFGQGKSDWLYGGAGADTLTGKGGNDYLEGGSGFDTYVFNAGDGHDTVLDADGLGIIKFGAIAAIGSTSVADGKNWIQLGNFWTDKQNSLTYRLVSQANGTQDLYINSGSGSVRVKDWSDGELGIALGANTPVPPPVIDLTIVGDLQPIDFDPTEPGVQTVTDDLGNVIVSGDAAPGREDVLYGGGGNDHILSLGGDDYADGRGGDDRIEGGAGQDLLQGRAGNDILIGGVDSDVLAGGADDDRLYAETEYTLDEAYTLGETQAASGQRGDLLDGGYGDDVLIGDAGNDILMGGTGKDVLMGLGGDDTIEGDADFVYAERDWSVTRVVTIENGHTLYSRNYSFSTVGTDHDAAGDDDVIYGGAGNDWIFAQGGNDFVDGGADDDVIFGGAGNDIILGQGGHDVLVGDSQHPDLDASLHGDDYLSGGDGNDKLWGGGGADYLEGGDGNDLLVGDGMNVPEEYEGDDVLDGGAGDDQLFGGGGNDTLIGGAGADQLYGGAGVDTYIDVGAGDVIGDLEGRSIIRLAGSNGVSTTTSPSVTSTPDATLKIALDNGTTLDLQAALYGMEASIEFSNGDAIDLETWVSVNLTQSVMLNLNNVQLSSGAAVTRAYGGAGSDQIQGGTGNDVLKGYGGDDLILGMDGNDQLYGGTGNDHLQGDAGDDTLDGGDGADSLLGGDGADTLLGGAGNDELQGGMDDDMLDGGSGDDTLFGQEGSDVLDGGTGNDVLLGNAGDDVYVFNLGGGQDVIWEEGDSAGDVLRFGEGIAPADISVAKSGSNLVLFHANGVDQVTISNWYLAASYRLARFEFADDTVWNGIDTGNLGLLNLRGTLGDDAIYGGALNETLVGLDGNDQLYGNGGNDVLVGGKGNDALTGGSGADTYLFSLGDGADLINGDNTDTLQFGADISSSDIAAERVGYDLVLSHPNGTDRVRIANWYSNTYYQLQKVLFDSDGTVWSASVLSQKGIKVDHQYFLNLGDGAKTIEDWGGMDSLTFGADISETDMAIARVGQDLQLSHMNGVDKVTVKDWFNDLARQIETIQFSTTGTVLTEAQLTTPFLTLMGTSGNDVIQGGNAYGETLSGQGGNDTLNGGGGVDTYYFNLGDGQDTITDTSFGNTLIFGTGLLSLLNVSYSNGDTIYSFGASGDSVRVTVGSNVTPKFVANGTASAETINGSAYGDIIHGLGGNDVIYGNAGDDVLYGDAGNDTLIGGAGSDWLYGGDGDDILDGNALTGIYDYEIYGSNRPDYYVGGKGNDTLYGNSSDDTYFFDLGDGNDTIIEGKWFGNGQWFYSSWDQLVFGAGITPENILVTQSGSDLLIRVSASDSVTIRDWFSDPVLRVDYFQFADGRTLHSNAIHKLAYTFRGTAGADELNAAPWYDSVLYGLEGDDTLNGGYANDELYGGPGNDTLKGNTGNDVYHFERGGGSDIVYDIGGTDTVRFASSISANELEMSRIENNLVMSVRGTADKLTINGFFNGDIYVSSSGTHLYVNLNLIEKFIFDDGSQLPDITQIYDTFFNIRGTVGNDIIVGTPWADVIFGGSGNDVIRGMGFNDVLYGEDGNDYLEGGNGSLLYGGNGDDILVGASKAYMYGGLGNDTYYPTGDQGYVSDEGGSDDRIAFFEGVYLYDLRFQQQTYKTNLSIVMPGGVYFTVYNQFLDNAYKIEKLVFHDGTIMGLTDIQFGTGATLNGTSEDSILIGTSANETLNGGAGNDWLDGGGGNDTMVGGTGNDIYFVDNSKDTVTELANQGIDTVASSITYTLGSSVENLILTGNSRINGTGNVLNNVLIGNSAANTLTGGAGNDWLDGGGGNDTMAGGTGDDTYVVDSVGDKITERSNEGTDRVLSSVTYTLPSNVENLTLTGDAVINGTGNALNNVLIGNSAANMLSGGAGNDTLDGMSGTDTLTGGKGNDTYVMGRGYSVDTVVENDTTTGNLDIAQFLSGVATDQIWFQHVGNNLEASIIGTGDKLVIQDWYSGDAYRVEQFKTADGSMTLLSSQVENLVSAMASFAPPAAGQTTLPTDYQASLAPVIAANWQ